MNGIRVAASLGLLFEVAACAEKPAELDHRDAKQAATDPQWAAPDSGAARTGPKDPNLAKGRPTTASRALPAELSARVVDDDRDSAWSSGDFPPQWIEVDLGRPERVREVRLVLTQHPDGSTTHRILGSKPGGQLQLLKELKGFTRDGDVLVAESEPPWDDIQMVRIETVESPSWVGLRELRVVGPEPAREHRTYDETFLVHEPNLYSQFREEVLIRHFFKDRRSGFFLDVGSAEWDYKSTTYFLERHLGWHGIAIDARAELALGYANRPNTKFFSYAVTDRSGRRVKFFTAGGLSSLRRSHLTDSWKIRDPGEVEVTTITLNDLLAREKVEKIDFLSMDIEEAEPSALAGFDIGRYRPELVCIEINSSTVESITAYFVANDYERVDEYLRYDKINWYFTPKR